MLPTRRAFESFEICLIIQILLCTRHDNIKKQPFFLWTMATIRTKATPNHPMHEGKTWRIGMARCTTLSATWTYINTTFCWLASVTSLEICHVVWTCHTSKFCTEKVQKLESGVAFGCLVASAWAQDLVKLVRPFVGWEPARYNMFTLQPRTHTGPMAGPMTKWIKTMATATDVLRSKPVHIWWSVGICTHYSH